MSPQPDAHFEIPLLKYQGRWPELRHDIISSPLYSDLQSSDSLLSKDFVDAALKAVSTGENIESGLTSHATLIELTSSGLMDSGISGQDLLRLTQFINQYLVPDGNVEITTGFVLNEGRLDLCYAQKVIKSIGGKLRALATDLRSHCKQLAKISGVSTPIVRNEDMFLCECGNFSLVGVQHCVLCHSDLSLMTPISLPRLDPLFRKFIANNMWAELGVARLLERKGFSTLVGAEIQGVSGRWHEVDVLASDSNANLTILVEVVSKRANLTELAPVLLRNLDLQPNRAILVSILPADDDAVQFGLRHGISVIGDVRSTPNKLLKWVECIRSLHSLR